MAAPPPGRAALARAPRAALALAAAVALALGGAGCHKAPHRTSPGALTAALSSAFERAYAAYYRMTTDTAYSKVVRSAQSACVPRGPEPAGGAPWRWSCRIVWSRRDLPGRHVASYAVAVDPRGCFEAASSSFPARVIEKVLARPEPDPLTYFRSCP
jgi:hypothetical protein